MRVCFGPFAFDPETRELLRGTVPVPLSPKAFDLLSLLIANRPKAMAKSDLQERLWPTTFVVEKNLTNLIGEIREALGDDPADPQFIRTLHRFGYAFHETRARAEARPASRGEVSFLVKWVDRRVALGDGEHVLGRDPAADIFLNHAGVSRRHARIMIAAGTATIEDLGSKNGTFIGDGRVDGPRSLGDGDIIGVGSARLTFRVAHAPLSTETTPEGGFPGLTPNGRKPAGRLTSPAGTMAQVLVEVYRLVCPGSRSQQEAVYFARRAAVSARRVA